MTITVGYTLIGGLYDTPYQVAQPSSHCPHETRLRHENRTGTRTENPTMPQPGILFQLFHNGDQEHFFPLLALEPEVAPDVRHQSSSDVKGPNSYGRKSVNPF